MSGRANEGGLEREREDEGLVGEATKVISFAEKLDGIDYALAVSEGFPLAYTKMSSERAETASALAVDLSIAADIYISDLVNSEVKSVMIIVKDGRVISVSRVKGLILLIEGTRRVTEEVTNISLDYLEGRRTRCPYCGYDLTLEVIKCPTCGRSIPFRVDTCPHCNTNVRIKKCPKCGRLVTTRGKRVEVKKRSDALQIALLEGALGGVGLAALAFIATQSIPLAALLGLAGGAAISLLIYKNIGSEYRIADSGEASKG